MRGTGTAVFSCTLKDNGGFTKSMRITEKVGKTQRNSVSILKSLKASITTKSLSVLLRYLHVLK